MAENSNYKPEFQGLITKEKHTAEKLFEAYRDRYNISSFSDLQLLTTLVFREILQIRYKKKISSLNKNLAVKDAQIIPRHLMDSLDSNEEKILILKEKLNLFKERQEEDPFNYLETLKKKFELYRKDYPEEFKTTCPFCSEVFFLNIRTTNYKESKLKLYKDKVLCNEHLWHCYKENKITKTDMASILNVSADYVDWLESKIYYKETKTNNDRE